MPEHHVADRVFSQQAPETDSQRLVMIVLADEDRAPGPIALRDDRRVIVGVEERRLLDQHVLARGERLLRQVEMETRWDGYDDGVDAAIGNRLVIAPKRCATAELAAELFRLPVIAARVARDNRARQPPFQVLAVDSCDESAPEEGDMQRLRHAAQAFFFAVPPI
jgi:hypothetical protein